MRSGAIKKKRIEDRYGRNPSLWRGKRTDLQFRCLPTYHIALITYRTNGTGQVKDEMNLSFLNPLPLPPTRRNLGGWNVIDGRKDQFWQRIKYGVRRKACTACILRQTCMRAGINHVPSSYHPFFSYI